MLGTINCDSRATLDELCTFIRPHDPTRLVGPLVERLIGPTTVLVIVYITGRLAGRILGRTVRRAGGDPQVETLIHNVVTVVTLALAVLSALVASGLDISVLLTFGGLASLAIGLAFQDLLRNVLAGIFLLLERPFRIGDFITVDKYSGTVLTIQLRTTKLRTVVGELAVLPNLVAFNSTVVNASAYGKGRHSVRLRLPEDANLDEVMANAAPELAAVREVASEPPLALRPELVIEGAMLRCDFWLDHDFDADAILADVSRCLWRAAETARMAQRPSGGT